MAAIDTTILPVGTWVADPIHSTVGFSVRHMVVATFRGRFEEFEITATATPEGEVAIHGTVKPSSIVVKDPNLAGHLQSPDFFDSEQFPAFTFASTSVRREGEEVVVEGDLTIKGVTHPVAARGTVTEPHLSFGDAEKVGLQLETVIDRTAFGLAWNAPLPKGGSFPTTAHLEPMGSIESLMAADEVRNERSNPLHHRKWI